MTKNDDGLAASVEAVRDRVVESGHAMAAQASDVKDQLAAGAAVAKDKAEEVMHAVADQIPSTPQEWEAAGKDLVAAIKRNPRPWVIGAAIFVVAWLLGRRSR